MTCGASYSIGLRPYYRGPPDKVTGIETFSSVSYTSGILATMSFRVLISTKERSRVKFG